MTLSDETVTQVTPGIIATDDGYQCLQCGNTDKRYMTILQNLRLHKVRILFLKDITTYSFNYQNNNNMLQRQLYKQLKRFTHYYYMRLLVRVRLK